MDVQAELAKAINKRFTKVYGVERSTPQTAKSNGKTSRRQEPTLSDADKASRSEAKKAAAAALMAKMGGGPKPPSPPPATKTPKTGKRSLKMPFSSPKRSSVANATAASGGPLSKTEEETAQRYRKMMKMGLPEGAVRHKMISDGVSERVVQAVMSGEESSPPRSKASSGFWSLEKPTADTASSRPGPSLSKEEETIAKKYRKMMNIGMPEGAVLHKMIADGVSAKIQDSVMAGEPSSTGQGGARIEKGNQTASNPGVTRTTRSSKSSLSPEEEKIAAQYRTMIRIKMPEGAVRHKMAADGVPQKIQDSVLGGDVPETSSTPSATSTSSRGGKTGVISSLSREDEMVATPYRKMMKMGLPEGAVKHKMTRDGISASIQDSVIREEIPREDSQGGADATAASQMRPPANPMAAAIASSGGIGSLKKGSMKEKNEGGGSGEAPVRPPANPMAAAIASSGGISSLKKTPLKPKNEDVPVRPPANPMAAAIASSGGIRSLKKTPAKPKKAASVATPSNPLAAAIAASGGQRGLKKTPAKAKSLQSPKPNSGNGLVDELSGRDFRYTLKKTPPKSPDRSPEVNNTKGFLSALKKLPQTSPDGSPDVSINDHDATSTNSVSTNLSKSSEYLARMRNETNRLRKKRKEHRDSTTHSRASSHASSLASSLASIEDNEPLNSHNGNETTVVGVNLVQKEQQQRHQPSTTTSQNSSNSSVKQDDSLRHPSSPEESPESSVNTSSTSSSRHLSGIKIKAVRPVNKEPERGANITNEDDKPRRLSGGIRVKGIRSHHVSPAGLTERSTNTSSNEDDSPRRLSGGIRIKGVRSNSVSPEELSRGSYNASNENDSPRHLSRMKIKSERSPEERPKTSFSIGPESKNIQEQAPRRSIDSIEIRDLVSNLGSTANPADESERSGMRTKKRNSNVENSDKRRRSHTIKTADESQRSTTRTKEPNSKLKNSDKRRKSHSIKTTDADGVDHHCQCIVM